ncbi:LacI family DNA-binding transcriptional regulator [Megasphaera sp.]|uniref:LacI family DNA-binding transcriptional regulator n=1 Tax=Megasphaera sp. TaxID=2023260 RepID=UPI003F7F0F79
MNITIYDIAQKCNVSIATVSRVLNGSTRVSEKTRAKVLQVMKEMGYKPNPFARGLGLDSMKIVGVICTDVADIFYAHAVSLLEDGLRKHHFDVMLSNTGSDTGHNGKYISAMADKHVDAIITIGTPFSSESDVRQLCETARQIPVITINSDYHQPNMYSVVCNEKEGMKMVIAALAAKNCQDILYIYDSLTYSGRHKLDGFRQGIREWRLTEKPELIQQIPRTLQDTEALIDRLVADDIPFDAIVTSEDIFSVAAQRAALRHGKNIPVIGCNNSILAQCATPTITSLDNKLTSLCNAAVHIVTELTGKEADSVPVRTEFSADLVERESFRR